MNILLIVFGVWLVPGIVAYLIGCLHSGEWSFDKHDSFLLIPIVNIIVLGLVLVILFDELVIDKIWK